MRNPSGNMMHLQLRSLIPFPVRESEASGPIAGHLKAKRRTLLPRIPGFSHAKGFHFWEDPLGTSQPKGRNAPRLQDTPRARTSSRTSHIGHIHG